ncbi:hypothetical protein BGW36DRAFT_296269 [Talaromyces proteolyticus]|uniref:Uncharacterized protein n=1 Tax=Talaromyces proteolyticus TaxID=1131652 RepID=A0AAD4Q112_9EURO|nr:uncharacterized protein BGW36DRAFT_296269 [Talaromyces proteolyticus]KAH8697846.1 hypothetical protein BGW36DRAFT_296269 [Talaromyces proteolyticus]
MNLKNGIHSSHNIPLEAAISKHTVPVDSSPTTSLLSACAGLDKGGGVCLLNDTINGKYKPSTTFAIYSTAVLPQSWLDILLCSVDRDRTYIERLNELAKCISANLPIYTSWDGLGTADCSEGASSRQLHSLPTSLSTLPHRGQTSQVDILTQSRPRFLLNACLYKNHCIIGHHSVIQTLLIVLRRPWCVLEICVGSTEDDYSTTNVLMQILSFARLAQQRDKSGYETAVFLLEHELEKRHDSFDLLSMPVIGSLEREEGTPISLSAEEVSYKRLISSYERCNRSVFLTSLKSFNSFWICLICVFAVEIGVTFSSIIDILAGGKQKLPKQRVVLPAEQKRRKSERSVGLVYSPARYDDTCGSNDIAEDMVQLYELVLLRIRDCV